MITAAHLRVRKETGAQAWILVLGILSTVTVLVTFALTTLVDEPATAATLVAILVISIVIDLFGNGLETATRPRPHKPARTRDDQLCATRRA